MRHEYSYSQVAAFVALSAVVPLTAAPIVLATVPPIVMANRESAAKGAKSRYSGNAHVKAATRTRLGCTQRTVMCLCFPVVSAVVNQETNCETHSRFC